MICEVRNYLHQFGEIDEKLLKAIQKVDRKNFMDENKKSSYENEAIPIGHGQTISQPSTVARMLSLLELNPEDEVLEIGTGSAWNAAVLGFLSKNVLTTEIIKEHADRAREKLENLKINNVKVKQEDFRKIKKKFNKIIFTAGITNTQEPIIEQYAREHLKNNGILLCPYQSAPLIIIKNRNQKFERKYSQESYNFVPLILD